MCPVRKICQFQGRGGAQSTAQSTAPYWRRCTRRTTICSFPIPCGVCQIVWDSFARLLFPVSGHVARRRGFSLSCRMRVPGRPARTHLGGVPVLGVGAAAVAAVPEHVQVKGRQAPAGSACQVGLPEAQGQALVCREVPQGLRNTHRRPKETLRPPPPFPHRNSSLSEGATVGRRPPLQTAQKRIHERGRMDRRTRGF